MAARAEWIVREKASYAEISELVCDVVEEHLSRGTIKVTESLVTKYNCDRSDLLSLEHQLRTAVRERYGFDIPAPTEYGMIESMMLDATQNRKHTITREESAFMRTQYPMLHRALRAANTVGFRVGIDARVPIANITCNILAYAINEYIESTN